MTKIRFGDYAVLDMKNLEVIIFNRKAKLKPVNTVPEEYFEPFIGVKEPEAWLCIEKKRIVVKVENKFFIGTIED